MRRNSEEFAPEEDEEPEFDSDGDSGLQEILDEVDEIMDEIDEHAATNPFGGTIQVGEFGVSLMISGPCPGFPFGKASYHASGDRGSWGGEMVFAAGPVGRAMSSVKAGECMAFSISCGSTETMIALANQVFSTEEGRQFFWTPYLSYDSSSKRWSPWSSRRRGGDLARELFSEGTLILITSYLITDTVVAFALETLVQRIISWPGSGAQGAEISDWHTTDDIDEDSMSSGWPA